MSQLTEPSPKTSKKYSVISNEVRKSFINEVLSKKISIRKVVNFYYQVDF